MEAKRRDLDGDKYVRLLMRLILTEPSLGHKQQNLTEPGGKQLK